ncbi:MAG TPA: hypothetical protein VN761_05645 [Candidatus Polarisedimenticolia bacterium]|nr:hypothetical protein [Candidatus Polarisedimenticolia bacterium]
MKFSQRFIRSVIRLVWNQAKKGADTFLEALNTGQSGQWENVGTGWTVQSSSGAGYATSFHIPMSADDPIGLTPSALQELFEILLEAYAAVKAAGTVEEEDGDAIASAFVAAMWARFPTIKGFTNNYMYLTP